MKNYNPLPRKLTIRKSNMHGLGLFATENIPKGTELGMCHLNINSVLIRTPLGGFYNHSDNPNCVKYEKHNKKGYSNTYYYLKTTKNIMKDEELTVKYTLYKM